MSDQDTVFDDDSDKESSTKEDKSTNASLSFLEQLVGEGKKYASAEELAKGQVNADQHIKTLESENEELRLRNEKAATVEDVLAALKEKPKETPEAVKEVKSLSEEDVLSLLDKKEQEKKYTSNIKEADKLFREHFGDASDEVFKEKVKELGVSPAHLKNVAADSPRAFMAFFGVSPSQRPSSSPSKPSNVSLPSTNNQGELTVQSLLAKAKQEGRPVGLTDAERQVLIKQEERKLGIGI